MTVGTSERHVRCRSGGVRRVRTVSFVCAAAVVCPSYGGWLESALLSAGFSEAEMLSIRLWADYYPKQPNVCVVWCCCTYGSELCLLPAGG